MYRVAVIQNQSEAFELSYGNSFALFKQYFPDYSLDLFSTQDGMRQLLATLPIYDAVIFTSDALGDTLLRQFWLSQDNQAVFDAFLQSGKGILVLHQDKMVGENYSFLGEGWSLLGCARGRIQGDYPIDGKLSISAEHVIVRYPEKIDLERLASTAKTSPQVTGLYWHYMFPEKPERWISVVQDATYVPPRDILLTSSPYTNGRIVVTSLALERQQHIDLLRNVVIYVVEGNESLAVLRRDDHITYEFRYLLSYLNVNRVAYREYRSPDLATIVLPRRVHSVAIIDPGWTPADVTPEVMSTIKSFLRPEGKVVYFGTRVNDEPSIITLGGRIPFRLQYRDSITWLKGMYDRDMGLWDGSFFSSTHVIEALVAFGESLDEYKSATLEYIYKHDLEGGYDNVFGAACEMARMYYLFGAQDRFQRAVSWIRHEMKDLQKSAPDLARAYLMFRICGVPANESDVRRALSMDVLPDSDTNLVHFLRTAVIYGLDSYVPRFASAIVGRQGSDGSWGVEQVNRIMITAAAIEALIEARGRLLNDPQIRTAVEDTVLKGIIYLQSFDLDHTPTPQKAATIAMALLAVYQFSNEIFFPIEDFMTSQRLIQMRTTNIASFDAATNLISRLQKDKALLDSKYQLLEREHRSLAYFRRVATTLTLFLLLLTLIVVVLIAYSIIYAPKAVDELGHLVGGVTQLWVLPYWWVGAAAFGLWLILELTRLNLLPRGILRILQFLGGLFGLNISEAPRHNDEGKSQTN